MSRKSEILRGSLETISSQYQYQTDRDALRILRLLDKLERQLNEICRNANAVLPPDEHIQMLPLQPPLSIPKSSNSQDSRSTFSRSSLTSPHSKSSRQTSDSDSTGANQPGPSVRKSRSKQYQLKDKILAGPSVPHKSRSNETINRKPPRTRKSLKDQSDFYTAGNLRKWKNRNASQKSNSEGKRTTTRIPLKDKSELQARIKKQKPDDSGKTRSLKSNEPDGRVKKKERKSVDSEKIKSSKSSKSNRMKKTKRLQKRFKGQKSSGDEPGDSAAGTDDSDSAPRESHVSDVGKARKKPQVLPKRGIILKKSNEKKSVKNK